MMRNSAFRKACIFILALALALGMLVSAVSISLSHLPVSAKLAEQARHAELSTEAGGRGHSHDDGEIDERLVGHNHAHDPSDHSHETQHLFVHLYSNCQKVTGVNFIDIPQSNELGAFSRLERPPKSISLI